MKAAVWHGRQDVRVEEVKDPPGPSKGQVQVQVAWCGICGTDLHEYMGGPLYIPTGAPHPVTGVQAPVIIGHEMSGRITAVGDGVEGFWWATGGGLPYHRLWRVSLVQNGLDGPVRQGSLSWNFLVGRRPFRKTQPLRLPVLPLARLDAR